MKKKLADEIGRAFVRLQGKKKLIDNDVLTEPWWIGKRCNDCRNERCKSLGVLPKGYDCALWQPKVENYSIKTVTNAKEAEDYPISEDISKGIEEINKLIFENAQAESEVRNDRYKCKS